VDVRVSERQAAAVAPSAFLDAVGPRLDGHPLLLLLDVDGTLAPIAPRPDQATVPRATTDVLRRLMGCKDVAVALISGRSAEDARTVAQLDGAWIVGNHGLELRTPQGELTPNPQARTYEAVVADAARALGALEREVPGSFVENKRWSLSVHFRLADPGAVSALRDRVRDVARAAGLRVTDGKKIFELRPPVRVDKGTAALDLAKRIGALTRDASILLAGDDRTDEDAFQALRALDDRAVTVRIAPHEDDGESTTYAEFVLASPEALRVVLELLATRRGLRA
jgi:trehalose-phosphatase